MRIMTGKTGTPHVTSQLFRQLVEGTVGQGSYILTSGENLEPELSSNNLLKIRSGMMSHHGNLSVVDIGTYDEVTIQNGTQGMKRIDLVVNRYTKNEETGLEDNEWVVIMGTPVAADPVAPAYTEGNLQEGDLVDDCPVYEVHLDGINVTEVVKLLTVASNISDLEEEVTELIGNSYKLYTGILGNLEARPYTLKKYNDGTFELDGRLDASRVTLQYSDSAKMYFIQLTAPIPEELDIDLSKKVTFSGSVESAGIYFLTPVSVTSTTLTAYLSAMNYVSEIPLVSSGFALKGWWK